MSHTTGRVVSVGTQIGPKAGPATTPGEWTFSFTPNDALAGGLPRYVILHFTDMIFPVGSRLEVNLGYDTDTFTGASGPSAWTRPIDPALGPIEIRYFGSGAVGGVTLFEDGSGEPTATPGNVPGTPYGSLTNQDVFLHTNPYVEPTYETRLQCGGVFDWQNAACAEPGSVLEQAVKATGIIISTHGHSGTLTLSSCTVTLIDADLVMTAAHCLTHAEVPSASVTFDFQTDCAGTRPPGYSPRFHKVKRIVRQGGNDVSAATDWLILQIETPPAGLGIEPRPLRASLTMPGETIFAVHHPNGGAKKIQQGVLTSGDASLVSNFDYAGGSSGSGLFDSSGNLVGAALSRPVGVGGCDVAYCTSREVLNQLAMPPFAPKPFDVMLVLDRSGSMNAPGTTMPGVTKMDEAEDAAQLFVQLVRTGAGDRMGMVAFSTSATRPPNVALDLVNAAQKTALNDAIEVLTPGGSTSIGDGLLAAMESLPPGSNRAILLMTDGLHNTDPSIATGEAALGDTQLAIVGFGTEANLDGPRLTTLARKHRGIYTHTSQGLTLKKFFSLSFGNIFASGMLADPEFVLPADERVASPQPFQVCEEEQITAVIGWNDPSQPLEVLLRTPAGSIINAETAGVEGGRGQTWQFLRVALPVGGEREGTWQWEVHRLVTRESLRFGEVRYFVAVIADGGPKFQPLPQTQRIYTGDPINPLVMLRYANGVAPHGEVEVTIEAPDVALGQLTTNAGGAPPIVGEDPVDAFRATLQKAAGSGPLVVPTRTVTVPLFDDGVHQDGGFEPDGIWGNPLTDLTRYEGNYTFHARARFGDTCTATRETFWSVAVEPGIHSGSTTVEMTESGKVKFTPRDRFRSPLGPGRGASFEVFGQPGTTTGAVTDNRDGSYTVDVTVEPDSEPGIVITQPDRPPVVIAPPKLRTNATAPPAEPQAQRGCALWLWILLALFVLVLMIVLLAVLL